MEPSTSFSTNSTPACCNATLDNLEPTTAAGLANKPAGPAQPTRFVFLARVSTDWPTISTEPSASWTAGSGYTALSPTTPACPARKGARAAKDPLYNSASPAQKIPPALPSSSGMGRPHVLPLAHQDSTRTPPVTSASSAISPASPAHPARSSAPPAAVRLGGRPCTSLTANAW
jgi:hypothetical protein